MNLLPHSNAYIEKAEKTILYVVCIQVHTYTSGKQCQSLHILIVHNIIKSIFFKFVFICMLCIHTACLAKQRKLEENVLNS